MQFLKNGILIDVTKKAIRIYFETEEQKQKFDNEFSKFFKMKYPGRVVMSDVAEKQFIAETFKKNNYDILDNMRSFLNKQVSTIGILLEKDITKIRSGKFKIQLYFK